jgi:hypothetical protein
MIDEMVQMPDCITCGKNWEMSKGEYAYYTDMMRKRAPNFSMPTHCRECRKKKKEKFSWNEAAEFLNKIIVKAEKQEYALDDEKLVEDLKTLGRMVKRLNYISKEENVKQEA